MVVRVLNREIGLEQVDDGLVGRSLAVGDRPALDDEPVLRPGGVDELLVEARLAHTRLGDRREYLAATLARLIESALKVIELIPAAH